MDFDGPPITNEEVEWAVCHLEKRQDNKARRNGEIFKSRRDGATWRKIAEKHGISETAASAAYGKIFQNCMVRRKRNKTKFSAYIRVHPLTPFIVHQDWQEWTPESQATEFRRNCI